MDNLTFNAVDFETATNLRSSICEIGITEVVNGEITASHSWLVKPPQNTYFGVNMSIHGITPDMTENAPTFGEMWNEIIPYFEGKIIVAHNTAFDMYALRDALDLYDIEYPTFTDYCSLRLSRSTYKGLYNYTLPVVYEAATGEPMGEHHRGGSDSEACAKIFIACMEKQDCDIEELADKLKFRCGRFSPGAFMAQRAIRDYSKREREKFVPVGDPDKVDEDSYFYGKSVCFTGKFSFAIRKELEQMIADIGGTPMGSVTSKTDILVVGQQDYRIVGSDGMSSKQEKAMAMLSKGLEIEILSEKDFISYI